MKTLFVLSYTAIVFLGMIFGLVLFEMGHYIYGFITEVICVLSFLFPVRMASEIDLKDLQIKTLKIQIKDLNSTIDKYR